jgi:hypothetical protein
MENLLFFACLLETIQNRMTNDSELLIILRLQYHNEKNRPYFKEKKSKLAQKGERENRSGRSWNFFRPEFRVFCN